MITTIFSKSQPVNFAIIGFVMVLCYILFQIQSEAWVSAEIIATKITTFFLLIFSVLLANFIGNKNNLQKNSAFSVLFFVLFVLLIPDVFNNFNLVAANILVLFAIRRLISMQSQIDVKQKIFDASILIFVATLFKFWAIMFLFLIFASIVFHAPRDYRNWIVPIVAFFATAIAFLLLALLVNPGLIKTFWNSIFINTNFDYFKNTFQNLSISFYASISVLFTGNLISIYARKTLTSHPHFKTLLFTITIGLLFYIVTPNKNNSSLLFTFGPMAILAANFFDTIETKWIKETTAVIIILMSFVCFLGQLY